VAAKATNANRARADATIEQISGIVVFFHPEIETSPGAATAVNASVLRIGM
jgi:hypothetical protein